MGNRRWACWGVVALGLATASCRSRVDSFGYLEGGSKAAGEKTFADDPQNAMVDTSSYKLAKLLNRCDDLAGGGAADTPDAVTFPVDAGRLEENVFSRVLEPIGIVTVPGALLYEGLRWFLLEDFDSLFEGSNYVTFVDYAEEDGKEPLDGDSEVDIYVEHLLVDNFTEGRWRDSLGGDGEELTLQVSLNGLTPSGSLLKDDTQFLIEKAVEIRDPVMALVSGNPKGAELVAKYNRAAEKVLDFSAKQVELTKKAQEWWNAKVASAFVGNKDALIAQLGDELKSQLMKVLDDAVAKAGVDDAMKAALKEGGAFVIDEIVRWFRAKLSGVEIKEWTDKLLGRIDKEVGLLLTASDTLAQWAKRYSIDQKGLVETVQAVQGLASADRLMVLPFNGIRPRMADDRILGGASFGGTAARLLMRGSWAERWYIDAAGRAFRPESPAQVPGLVYRGKVRDVAATGDAAGITLSTLLLELDSDELVKLLRYASAFVSEGASIGGGSAEIAVSAVVEAASLVAEKIAQNDVELKSIDLRFLPKGEADELSGSPGTQAFELRPCRVVVARNFHGTEFGAVAVIRIERGGTPEPAVTVATKLRELADGIDGGKALLDGVSKSTTFDAKGDRKAQYESLVAKIDALDAQADKISGLRAGILRARDRFVSASQALNAGIQDPDLRGKAAAVMGKQVERFNELAKKGDAYHARYDSVMKELHDVRIYLENDLTEAGIGVVNAAPKVATSSADAFKSEIENLQQELRKLADALEGKSSP